mmetsp:Transcript_23285/g.55009  ORF Transcript_23285/g.55009 Transcript_23285/m.55009 type:complete len:213 (-) Transcript_23285:325-963(-)
MEGIHSAAKLRCRERFELCQDLGTRQVELLVGDKAALVLVQSFPEDAELPGPAESLDRLGELVFVYIHRGVAVKVAPPGSKDASSALLPQEGLEVRQDLRQRLALSDFYSKDFHGKLLYLLLLPVLFLPKCHPAQGLRTHVLFAEQGNPRPEYIFMSILPVKQFAPLIEVILAEIILPPAQLVDHVQRTVEVRDAPLLEAKPEPRSLLVDLI